jgi:hypothetical protein
VIRDTLVEVELKEAFCRQGCPICRIGEASAVRYLRSTLHESVNDRAFRTRFHAAWGFCRRHAWHFLRLESVVMRDGLSTAILAEGLIEGARRVLDAGPLGSPEPRRRRREDRRLRNLRDSLQPGSPCPACVGQEQHESYALHVLMEVLPEAAWRERLASSDGLCLPHVRLALSDESTAPQLEWLLADQRRRLAALLGDLGEYIRKHDYRFVGEPPGSERDAFERGTAYVAGAWFELPGPARGDGPCT